MKRIAMLLLVLICCNCIVAYAEECTTVLNPLVKLIDQYSDLHGTKFVLNPRVAAKVTLVGIDEDNIDAAMLIGILNSLGYVALTSDGVVYVMPDSVAQAAGDKYGVSWEG